MRLWSIHPRYLDRQGLTACWREALPAQAVIAGRTKGYTRHPQLECFQTYPDPLEAIGVFLTGVQEEATRRGYRFDASRIDHPGHGVRLLVSDGQVAFEREHLLGKLRARSPECVDALAGEDTPDVHPMFGVDEGPVASWERP